MSDSSALQMDFSYSEVIQDFVKGLIYDYFIIATTSLNQQNNLNGN